MKENLRTVRVSLEPLSCLRSIRQRHRVLHDAGYLARASDPPPDNTVMWRGLSRLTDIELGLNLANGCG